MRCLSDVEIQQLTDGEAPAEDVIHAKNCQACAARLDERRSLIAVLMGAVATEGPSAAFASRLRNAVHADAPVRGATVLRLSRRNRRPLWAAIPTAGVVIILLVVLRSPDAPVTLSAAQVLDRSVEQMTGGTGVDELEYELELSSEYRWPISLAHGPYRIVQLFDRDTPGRYKLTQYDRDDLLVGAIAQDPARGRRTEMHRVDGRNFIIHVTSVPGPMMSLPQLLQTQGETILRLMQLNAGEHLRVLDDSNGVHYVIDLPDLSVSSVSGPLVLSRARVDVDGHDFRVREFFGTGTLFGLPFEVSFKLIRQVKSASIAASEWAIEERPDDVVFEGRGTGDADDSMKVVLRELSRVRGR